MLKVVKISPSTQPDNIYLAGFYMFGLTVMNKFFSVTFGVLCIFLATMFWRWVIASLSIMCYSRYDFVLS